MCALGKGHRAYVIIPWNETHVKYFPFLRVNNNLCWKGDRHVTCFLTSLQGCNIKHLVLFLLVVPKLFHVLPLLVNFHQVKVCLAAKGTGLSSLLAPVHMVLFLLPWVSSGAADSGHYISTPLRWVFCTFSELNQFTKSLSSHQTDSKGRRRMYV